MNKYVKYIILVVVIVACFIGIRALYGKLSENYKPESGLVENNSRGQVEEVVEDTNSGQVAIQTEEEHKADNRDTQQTTQSDNQTNEAKAIDFTVFDGDGNKISLYSKVGKPIVVNFWASWCGPCKTELPDFELAYEEYGDEVEFMMVNLTDGRSETVEGALSFVDTQGYTFPVYYDVNQEAAYAYYVVSIPTTYFIDSDGDITAYANGMIDYDTLVKGINMIIE